MIFGVRCPSPPAANAKLITTSKCIRLTVLHFQSAAFFKNVLTIGKNFSGNSINGK
jgi:hypothetical protein